MNRENQFNIDFGTARKITALAALLSCLAAYAETPLSLSITQQLTYDSNILKDNLNKYRDAKSTTGVRVGFNKDYGRQNYQVSATAVTNKYKNTKEYDNDGYNMVFGVSSYLASNFYASANHTRVSQLQSPEDQSGARYRETIESESTQLSLRYGLYGRWSVDGSLDNSKANYDRVKFYNRKSDGVRFGLRYSPTDLLYFDFGAKKSKIDYPNYPLVGIVGDEVKRSDVDLSSRWVVTGYSSLNARIAWTQEKHPNDKRRDFNGLTGSLSWDYTPSGKMTYSVGIDRDTNNAGGSTYGYLGLVPSYSSQNRLTTGVRLGAAWKPTSKLSVSSNLVYKQIEEDVRDAIIRDEQVIQEGSLKGAYRSLDIGANYQFLTSTSVGCTVRQYERRNSLFSRDYSGEEVTCNLVFAID